jgi:hypothetical protein
MYRGDAKHTGRSPHVGPRRGTVKWTLNVAPAQGAQPAERLWPLVREVVANQPIETLDELEALLVDRCRTLTASWKTIQNHTRFHWWPDNEHFA